tara:strand:+ start:2261 stop:2503 length:243 start_codon:yes stop_codon:yes gene_type:complete
MSPLILFIIFITAFTFILASYALNRLKDPIYKTGKKQSFELKNTNFWKNAETTNGRLAMMGFTALLVNYGLFGWIIPGFF